MAISSVNAYSELQSQIVGRKVGWAAPGTAPANPGAAESDAASVERVSISAAAQKIVLLRGLEPATLSAVESATTGVDASQALLDKAYTDLLDRAGKSDYLASIANPTDLSPQATADRILGGITGYIFNAFKMQNALTEDSLARFKADAERGFSEGLGSAQTEIDAAGKLDEGLLADIKKTADAFHKAFEDFFATESAKLKTAAG